MESAVRSSGLLLHPTSLPGPFGIGDLGPAAKKWIDILAQAEQSWWQILPLGPTGYGDSPYQSFSAFAGNPLMISPEEMIDDGLLNASDIKGINITDKRANFGSALTIKTNLFERAWKRFQGSDFSKLRSEFETFIEEEKDWLDDYVLFMAIKEQQEGKSWQEWPDDLRKRKDSAISTVRQELEDTIGQHRFRQFLFYRQWKTVRAYATKKGIQLIGDIPIFISSDSADVWANPQLFLLDKENRPTVVAGVPPDYFCETGQLWGNPHYDWDALRETGYAWWVSRAKATLAQVDLVRLDHFCGFESAWHVPADEETAINGKYVPGPSAHFFESMKQALDGLPFIAEDLGTVTPAVETLRDQFELPGMKVLHFAFGDDWSNPFLPHNYVHNSVAYTGTHDNNTSRGWYEEIPDDARDRYRRYTARSGDDVSWDLIRLAWSSVANTAIAPLQDILDLGGEARMNLPGHTGGNWNWRFTFDMLQDLAIDRLRNMTRMFSREPKSEKDKV